MEQRRRSAGVRVLAAGVATAYRNRRKKDQGGNVVLTEGLKWRMLQCRMAGVEIRRRRSTELVGEVVAGRLRASDPHERVLRRDAKPGRWSARLGGHRRRGNSTAEWRPGRRRRGGTGEGRRRTGERTGGVVVQGGRGVEAAELGRRSGMVGDIDGARGWRQSRRRDGSRGDDGGAAQIKNCAPSVGGSRRKKGHI